MQTLEELVKEYINLNKRIEDINLYIKESNKEKIKSALTKPSFETRKKIAYHDVLKEEKRKHMKMLNDVKERINICCTFDFNMIIDFIMDVISNIEKETYIKNNITFSKYKELKFIGLDNTEDICLIADYNNMSEVKTLKNKGKITNSIEVMDYIGIDKYIILDREKEYNVFDFDTLDIKKDITVGFPYLKNIIILLINRLLKGENISKVRDEILDSISNTYTEEEKMITK